MDSGIYCGLKKLGHCGHWDTVDTGIVWTVGYKQRTHSGHSFVLSMTRKSWLTLTPAETGTESVNWDEVDLNTVYIINGCPPMLGGFKNGIKYAAGFFFIL